MKLLTYSLLLIGLYACFVSCRPCRSLIKYQGDSLHVKIPAIEMLNMKDPIEISYGKSFREVSEELMLKNMDYYYYCRMLKQMKKGYEKDEMIKKLLYTIAYMRQIAENPNNVKEIRYTSKYYIPDATIDSIIGVDYKSKDLEDRIYAYRTLFFNLLKSIDTLTIDMKKKCIEINNKTIVCKEESNYINKKFKTELNNYNEKVVRDTIYLNYLYTQFLSKKKKKGQKILEDRNIIKPKYSQYIKDYTEYKCIINPTPPNDTCKEFVYDTLTNECKCIPRCPSPDNICQKYQYNPVSNECECKGRCYAINGEERYWDNEKKECKCKVSTIVSIKETDKRMWEITDTIIQGNDTLECLLAVATNGVDAIFTIGFNLKTKTNCSTYLKQLDYEPGEFDLPPTLERNLDKLLKRIKEHIKFDNKVIIKIVGTADNLPCHKLYQGNDLQIPSYYLMDENGNCQLKMYTDIKNNITYIDNPLLGILRSYQLKPIVDKYFNRSQYKTYYSIPYESHKGGGYRRLEIYILVRDFNKEYLEKAMDEKEFKDAFKDCNPCDSYDLLNNCK
jgi:hypothetical protein